MSAQIPEHGTSARYKGRTGFPGCRCRKCTAAASRQDALRRLDRLAGRPRLVDAARVRAHLQSLAADGMSHDQIAASSGVSQATVSHLASGRRKSVYSANEAALLAVRLADKSGSFYVSALGATRRIRALYTLGHGPTVLSALTGLHRDTITSLAGGYRIRILVGRDDAIRRAYGKLSMVVGVTREARVWSARQGWVPPLAWDDDTIDDPAAVPQIDAPKAGYTEGPDVVARWLMGESVVLDHDGRREVIAHLMEWTRQTPEEIGVRLEMSADAVSRSWERLKAKARDEGRTVPWRRVYVPVRDMDLTRDDMRSAA